MPGVLVLLEMESNRSRADGVIMQFVSQRLTAIVRIRGSCRRGDRMNFVSVAGRQGAVDKNQLPKSVEQDPLALRGA